jgi:hypothetical protein
MKQLAKELDSFIRQYEPMLRHVGEEAYSKKDSPGKWSRKEELGHLIDSAQNNLRRFLVAQYEINPKIVYDQEAWVKASNYKEQQPGNMITFWTSLNKQICETFEAMPVEAAERMCDTGKGKVELHSLRFLAEDYLRHMMHHLHHILALEAIPY